MSTFSRTVLMIYEAPKSKGKAGTTLEQDIGYARKYEM